MLNLSIKLNTYNLTLFHQLFSKTSFIPLLKVCFLAVLTYLEKLQGYERALFCYTDLYN